MAFGFPPSYSVQVGFVASREAVREAVEKTAELLGWKFELIDRDTYRMKTPSYGVNGGEKIALSITTGILEIRSASALPLPLFDFGKNKNNVRQFLSIFDARSTRYAKQTNEGPTYLDPDGTTPIERAINQ